MGLRYIFNNCTLNTAVNCTVHTVHIALWCIGPRPIVYRTGLIKLRVIFPPVGQIHQFGQPPLNNAPSFKTRADTNHGLLGYLKIVIEKLMRKLPESCQKFTRKSQECHHKVKKKQLPQSPQYVANKSTLPIDIPDKLRIECALDLSEPLVDISIPA